MKKTRAAIAALLASAIAFGMAGCSESSEESSFKSLDSATAEQVAQIAAEDERLTGTLENKTIKWIDRKSVV